MTVIPTYYAKVIDLQGNVIAAPLIDAGIEFTDVVFIPGQHSMGSFKIALPDIRDPRFRANRDVYHSLRREMRVEIYDDPNLLATPVYSGVITALPGDVGQLQAQGVSSLRRLESRRLYRNQMLSGNVADIVQGLLKTYQVVFKDDFNRSSLTADFPLVNPDYEEIPDLNGWTVVPDSIDGNSYPGNAWVIVSTNKAHSGIKSVWILSGQGVDIRHYQDLAVTPGVSYTWTFWQYNSLPYGARYSVYDNTHGVDIIPLTEVPWGSMWTQVSVPVTIPAGCTSARFYLWGPNQDGANIYYDDNAMTWYPWTVASGTWSIDPTGGYLKQTDAGGGQINKAAAMSQDFWNDCHFSFMWNFPNDLIGYGFEIAFAFQDGSHYHELGFADEGNGIGLIGVMHNGGILDVNRQYLIQTGVWYRFNVYTSVVGSNRRVIVLLNGVELINVLVVNQCTASGGFIFVTNAALYIDDVILMQHLPALAPGTIEATATTLVAPDQQFANDNQFLALDWMTEYDGKEYRVNAQKGEANDTLDWQTNVGNDLSDLICFYEGDVQLPPNILAIPVINLKRDNVSTPLANWLNVYGQAQDDVIDSAILTDLASFDVFGILEDDYQDPRVVSPDIARFLGQQRLNITKVDQFAITGSTIDLTPLVAQNPLIGGLIIGDTIIGSTGRQSLRAGDRVRLISDTFNIDAVYPLVGITRRSATNQVDFVLNKFPWRGSNDQRMAADLLEILRRSFINRMNTQTVRITASNDGFWHDWYLYIRGNVTVVYIDVRIVSGPAGISIRVDGVEHSAEWGAPGGGWVTDFHITDNKYLVPSGNHTLGFFMQNAGSTTIDVAISTKALS